MERYKSESRAVIEETERPFVMFDLTEFAIAPAARAAWYFFLIGGGIGVALVGGLYELYILFIPGFALFTAGAGGIAVLTMRLSEYDYAIDWRRTETRHEPEPEPAEAARVALDLGNGLGTVTIWEPHQGAFRRWLREVVDDGGRRVTFSKNQALRRGWTEDRYIELVAQLRQVALLGNGTFNGAPEITDEGLRRAGDWIG